MKKSSQPEVETRSATIKIRVTPTEERAWMEEARKDSRSLSGWVRYAANLVATERSRKETR